MNRRAAGIAALLMLGMPRAFAAAEAGTAERAAQRDVIQGAGATFPAKVYARWAEHFAAAGGARVVYKGTGSGDGVRQASDRKVNLGGTDAPLTPEELGKRNLIQVPMLVGGLVPVVNLPGIGQQRLRLSGDVLAEIMLGRIERWNDARIAELNPGLDLPALRVQRVVRADKSGSTEAFTAYLSQRSPDFAAAIGKSGLPAWPAQPLSAEGTDGVVEKLSATPGAITYVGFDRLAKDRLADVVLRNADGQWVSAHLNGFRAAIQASDLHRKGDDLASLLDRPGVLTWPITLTSFVLVDSAPATAGDVEQTLRFIYWCFINGDRLTQGTGFAPLPVSTQARVAGRIATVRPRNGQGVNYLGL